MNFWERMRTCTSDFYTKVDSEIQLYVTWVLSMTQANNLGVKSDPFSQIKKKKQTPIETVTSSSDYFDKYYL